MLVMMSNCKGYRVKALAERFPTQLAHLFAPAGDDTGWRPPFPWFDYAIDNGAFGPANRGELWPHGLLLRLLQKAEAVEMETGHRPLWIAVPDRPYQAGPTLELWKSMAPWFRALYDYPLALVVQDGMTPADVLALEDQPDVIFVGGSTTKDGKAGWKWDTLADWCRAFPRVHVGRVNSPEKLEVCHELGVESVDGTGWVRNVGGRQWIGLEKYLARHAPDTQVELPLAA
jgi:hypothetical protein